MRRALLTFCAAAVLLAACSSDSTPSGDGTTKPTTTTDGGSPTTDSTVAETTTTVAPQPTVPAGMQYEGEATAVDAALGSLDVLPDGSQWFAIGSTPSSVPICAAGTPGPCTRFASNPAFFSGTAPQSLTAAPIDDVATWPAPAGFPQPNYLIASAVVHGPGGYVAVGAGNFWDSNLFHRATTRAAMWQSADGVTWQRIALPAGLADRVSGLSAVSATDSGFVAVGEASASADPYAGPTAGVVLTSADGVTWALAAELSSPWAVQMTNVQVQGKLLLATGASFSCDATASLLLDFSVGAQTVVWSSADGGATWAPVDLAAAGVAGDRPAVPTDPAACPTDLSTRDKMKWSLGGVLTADGVFVLVSSAGGTTAASTDLATWTAGQVPNGAPTVIDGVDLEPASRILTADDEGLVLLSAEPRRDSDGYQSNFGTSVFGWRSSDSGATWQELAATRPLALTGSPALVHFRDGSVGLMLQGKDAAGAATRTLQFSAASPLIDWVTCEPAAGADCSFSAIAADVDLAGADLTGINLSGADLHDTVFDGAVLRNATLDGALLSDASFVGSDLTGALLRRAGLNSAVLGDATIDGADFSDSGVSSSLLTNPGAAKATLRNVTVYFEAGVPIALAAAGVDLRESSLYGPANGVAVLTGSSFAGANLAGTFFGGVDLTGVDFTGAVFNDDASGSVFFGSDVICPDGAPADTTQSGHAACRI